MEVSVQYLGNSKFEVSARGHRVICDQPLEDGGSDAEMAPPEFVLASLGTCAGCYAAQCLKTRGVPAGDLRVRVVAEKAQQPVRLSSFHLEVTAPGLDECHRTGITRAVKSCLVHNSLMNTPEIDTVIETGTLTRV